MVFVDGRAVDVMRATKEVIDDQEEKQKISFEVRGDSFKEVKVKIIEKIDAFDDLGYKSFNSFTLNSYG